MYKIIFIILSTVLTNILWAADLQYKWYATAGNTNIQVQSEENKAFSIGWDCKGFYVTMVFDSNFPLPKQPSEEADITIGNKFIYFNRVLDNSTVRFTPHFQQDETSIAEQLTSSEYITLTPSDSTQTNNVEQLTFSAKGFSTLFKQLKTTCASN